MTGTYPVYQNTGARDDGYGYQDDHGHRAQAHLYDDRYDDGSGRDPSYADQRIRDDYYYDRRPAGPGSHQRYPSDAEHQTHKRGDLESVSDVLEVPAEVAKMVIGSGGKSIKDLQDRTGARVMIHKPAPGEFDTNYRRVKVTGSFRSVDLAVSELRNKVREYEHSRGGGSGGGGGFHGGPRGDLRGVLRGDFRGYDDRGPPRGGFDGGDPEGYGGYGSDYRGGDERAYGATDRRHPRHPRDDFTELDVPCPLEHRGMIIGKGGSRVAKLERETGCKVRSDKDTPYVTLIGTQKAVLIAKQQVLAILAVANLPPMPDPPDDGEPPACEVPVPSEAIGKVMGLAGANIKAAQSVTRCFMNWDKHTKSMKLWGTEAVVAAGKEAIEKSIAEALREREMKVEKSFAAGQPRDGREEPAFDVPNGRREEDFVTEEVPVRGQGGHVIGKGGENVRRMEHRCGARMKIDREKQVVIVAGSKTRVALGRELIEQCIERAVAKAAGAVASTATRAAWTGAPEEDGEIDDRGEGGGDDRETQETTPVPEDEIPAGGFGEEASG